MTENRSNTELALEESEHRFRNLFESLGEGVLLCTREDIILHANTRMAELSGYSAEEMIGKPCYELFIEPDQIEFYKEKLSRRLEGVSERYEIKLRKKDRTFFWAEVMASPIRNAAGIIVGTCGAVTDISERKLVEQELLYQKEFLLKVLDADPNMIFVKDAKGTISLANRAFANLFGKVPHDLVGTHNSNLYWDNEEVDTFLAEDRQVLESGKTLVIPERSLTHPVSKQTFWAQAIKTPIELPDGEKQILVVQTDITARKLVEEANYALQGRLMQSQKMEAIGQLAAGIAHDLNNALSAVGGHLQLIQTGLDPASPLRRSAEVALGGCERAGGLIEQLLGFARQGKYTLHQLNSRKVLDETADFLGQIIGKGIQLVVDHHDDSLHFLADNSQVQQALINLVINAKQAMPNGGIITLASSRAHQGNPHSFNAKANPGNFIVLAVTDTGQGIPAAHLDKIFEPFFTTKDEDGYGLGLSMVYGIMQNHGGWVEVESALGAGSTFKLFFPEHRESASQESNTNWQEPKAPVGHIVVIDDEPSLVDLAKIFLERSGFKTSGFTAAEEALAWYESNYRDVDMIVLDMKMPRVSGKLCFERIRKINPLARVVILSGYIEDVAVRTILNQGALKFFQKPLRYPELVEWLTKALGGSRG